MISCAPHTSFGEINDNVAKSGRGELVQGSDPLLVYSANTTAVGVWRARTMLLLKIRLVAGVWKTETKTLDRSNR